MAKRLTDTELWDKEWFMLLSPKLKCLVKYVRDKCDMAGLWSPNWNLAGIYIGEDVNEKELFKIDNGKQFLKTDTGKIFCVGFTFFQYGKKLNPDSGVHKKVIEILESNFYKKHTLYDTLYSTVVTTVQDKEEDKEEEEEKDKEEEKAKEAKIEIVYPFTSELFLQKWKIWIDYRKEIKKPYKSPKSEQAALLQLSEFDEEFSIKLIERSIAGGYQGLVFDNTKAEYFKNGQTSKSTNLGADLNAIIERRYGNKSASK